MTDGPIVGARSSADVGNPVRRRRSRTGAGDEWGGWEDWETFREASLGTYSTKAKNRERARVDWL